MYIEYNGTKYYLIDSIYKGKKDNKLNVRNITKHENVLKDHLKDFKCETYKRINKTNNVEHTYKYYTHKENKKLILQEDKLIEQIENKVEILNKDIKSEKNKFIKKLNELYVLTKISIKEYHRLYNKIKTKDYVYAKINTLEKFCVDSVGMISFIYNNKKYKFKYTQ